MDYLTPPCKLLKGKTLNSYFPSGERVDDPKPLRDSAFLDGAEWKDGRQKSSDQAPSAGTLPVQTATSDLEVKPTRVCRHHGAGVPWAPVWRKGKIISQRCRLCDRAFSAKRLLRRKLAERLVRFAMSEEAKGRPPTDAEVQAGRRQGLRLERVRLRKRHLIEVFGGKCVDCGYSGHPAAFHFDHRDPGTKCGNVSTMMTGTWKGLVEELKKCDLVCANCHAIRTASSDRVMAKRKRVLAARLGLIAAP